MEEQNRRAFVTTVGTAGTLGLAGCLSDIRGLGGDSDDETTSNDRVGDDESTDSDSGVAGESVSDFEDTSEWTSMIDRGSFEAETDDVYSGSQSGRLQAAEGVETAGIYKTFPGGKDLSGTNLSLAVKFTAQEQLQLTVDVLAPNSRNVVKASRTLVGPQDRWVRVDFGATGVDTQPDLSEVREIRLVARRRGTSSGPIDCQIDDLRAVDRPETGAVMFLFDGTLESHYTHAFDHMESYGFAGVEAITPETVGRSNRLTIDKMETMSDAGWDMVARPRTGSKNLDEFTPQEQEGLIRRTKAYLENRGFEDGARHFVTPRNHLSTDALDHVKEYHEQAFRYGGAPNGLALTDPHNIGHFSGSDGATTKSFVDHAADYGQLAVLHFEHIGPDGLSEDAFEDLLEHVDELDIDVVTASDLLDRQ